MHEISLPNYRSGCQYVDALLNVFARILVVRIDLSYRKEYAERICSNDAKEDFKHLLNNRRSNLRLFAHCIGYLWKLEHTPDKGFHFHLVFIFDGSRVQNDVYLAAQIGEYWSSTITGGSGIYYSCNAAKDRYAKCGIGMIHYADAEKIACFKSTVLGYLCKDTQNIQDAVGGNQRSFGRGELPKRTSNAGRPRLFD